MLKLIVRKISDYSRLILFVAGVLVGVQLPSFVDQYKKSVSAHLIEAEKALSAFQSDADKHFKGDMDALIKHYLEQKDPVIKKGGKNITEIYIRVKLLQSHKLALKEGILGGTFVVLFSHDQEILNEVWESYSYTVPLDAAAISWGLAIALILSLSGDILLTIILKVTGIKGRLERKNKIAKPL